VLLEDIRSLHGQRTTRSYAAMSNSSRGLAV
jgi:hypothetical protein